MKQHVIAVTGINASDNPAPGMGVAKSLKYANPECTIVGLAYDAMEPGIYLDRYFDSAYMIPYPAAGERVLIERLLYIQSKTGIDVVIPTLDSEIPFYIRAAEELREHGIDTFLPTEEQFHLRDKQHLGSIASEADCLFPKQGVVNTPDELITVAGELGYPLMIKGAQYSAYRAENIHEALSYFSTVAAKWGYPVIAQEVVQGDEMNVIGIGDGHGDCPGLVAIRKMSTTELGKIWTGVTVNHPALIQAARDFVKAMQWRGAFELECIIRNEQVYLIEINPRFPAWVYFATGAGVNLPDMLLQCACDESTTDLQDDIPYEAGKLYVRYTDERICDMQTFQNMVTLGESR